jgi:2-deoxy-D-gluconate 3-dehydrogenase
MATQTIAQLFDLTGKGAIVTGGAMGIGQAIAFRLAEAGAGVMIADIDLEAASQTVEQIKSRGDAAQAIRADARSKADAKRVVEATIEAFGSLDILVNNAGIYPSSPILQTSEEMWDAVFDVNLKGVFFYSQTAAQEMVKAGHGGKIINIASIGGERPYGQEAPYAASKGGLVILTRAMALELAPYSILVNAVSPGTIMTPGAAAAGAALSASGAGSPEEIIEAYLTRVPLRRVGEPDDIAKVVLFLASAAADYMTGSYVLVDGGFLLS